MRTIKIRCGHGVEEVYGDLATPWKDKHGRQIYVGDIVDVRLSFGKPIRRMEAVFGNNYGFRLYDAEATDIGSAYPSVAYIDDWSLELVDPKPEAPANKCADCPLMRDPSNLTDDKWSER